MKNRAVQCLGAMLQNKYSFPPMGAADLEAVVAIERSCYALPWGEQQFLDELHNPVSRIDLLSVAGRLCGYICYWLIAGEMQILNIAVAADFRRQGGAGALLQHAIDSCRAARLEVAWLEVRESNGAAIALYRRHHFLIEGSRARYYRDGENALLMVRRFQTTD